MGFTTVKCPSCGASIDLDDSREFGFCSYCGTKVVQDKIIVEHRGTVKIEGTATAETLMERAWLMLEDGDFVAADKNFDRVLDVDPRNASAYFGRELCSIHVRNEAGLTSYSRSILKDNYYLKALQFSDGDEKQKYIELGNNTQQNENSKIVQAKQVKQANCLKAYKIAKNTITRRLIIALAIAILIFLIVFFNLSSEASSQSSMGIATFIGVVVGVVLGALLLSFSAEEIKVIRLYRKQKAFSVPERFMMKYKSKLK